MKGLDVELRDSVADGGEEKHFAVRRKARTSLGSEAGIGEAVGLATGERDDPEMRLPGVLGERDIGGGEATQRESGETVKSPTA